MWLALCSIWLVYHAWQLISRWRSSIKPIIPEHEDILFPSILVLWFIELEGIANFDWQPILLIASSACMLVTGTIATLRIIKLVQSGISVWKIPYALWLSLILLIFIVVMLANG